MYVIRHLRSLACTASNVTECVHESGGRSERKTDREGERERVCVCVCVRGEGGIESGLGKLIRIM